MHLQCRRWHPWQRWRSAPESAGQQWWTRTGRRSAESPEDTHTHTDTHNVKKMDTIIYGTQIHFILKCLHLMQGNLYLVTAQRGGKKICGFSFREDFIISVSMFHINHWDWYKAASSSSLDYSAAVALVTALYLATPLLDGYRRWCSRWGNFLCWMWHHLNLAAFHSFASSLVRRQLGRSSPLWGSPLCNTLLSHMGFFSLLSLSFLPGAPAETGSKRWRSSETAQTGWEVGRWRSCTWRSWWRSSERK